MGGAPARGVGLTVDRTPELDEAFRRDWLLPMPVKEMAAMYGVAPTTVSARARALGLPPRRVQADRSVSESPHDISRHGRWVLDPVTRVQVWEAA